MLLPPLFPSVVLPSVPITVLSQGVPATGLAPDIKRGVLNSLVSINGPSSPLASDDSQSPTDESEVFPVELQRTVTMEREVRVPV